MPGEESNDYVRFERRTVTAPPPGLGSGRPNDAVRPQPLKPGRRAKQSRLSSADGEHWARGGRDDAGGDAAQEELRESGAPVGTHDQDVGTPPLSGPNDLLVRNAFEQDTPDPNACLPRSRQNRLQSPLTGGPGGGLELLPGSGRGRLSPGDGHHWGQDVHHRELGPVQLREVEGPREGRARRR